MHTVCVATEYGEAVLREHPLAKVHCGRMEQEEIREFIRQGDFQAVVDATHPYADVVTANIKEAMRGMELPYFRLSREADFYTAENGILYFDSQEACAEALKKTEGNILLTTGSKELAKYCVSGEVKSRLFVRVIPSIESMEACMRQGICGKQILAMQGPFSAEMNEAVLRQYRIQYLVTKQSGVTGGYREKLEAAQKAGCTVFAVGRQKEEAGISFRQLCKELETICGQPLSRDDRMEVILAGAGMGSRESMTRETLEAAERADVLLGARRILDGFAEKRERYAYYLPEQIIPYLRELQESNAFLEKKRIVVLFSGDTGFYSGCKALYRALMEEREKGRLSLSVKILPGISSVAYLAACLGESYEDAEIYSLHGKQVRNLANRVAAHAKTFLLTSGAEDLNRLGAMLEAAGLDDAEIMAGYQLSYPQEQILRLTPRECCTLKKEGLYTCLIRNPKAVCGRLTHGMPDSDFIRERTPMTKEEVRDVSICKLKLHHKAVLYDIGSGTGSVAVEAAALSEDMEVYAVEQKREAVRLIEQNKKKFLLENLKVVEAKAPEGLSGLPVPTHAFIGGSGGRLKEILTALYEKNPAMRIVINAVSMETICEIKEVLAQFDVEEAELVQLSASRAKKTGNYHLMQAQNPVWICSFWFGKR